MGCGFIQGYTAIRGQHCKQSRTGVSHPPYPEQIRDSFTRSLQQPGLQTAPHLEATTSQDIGVRNNALLLTLWLLLLNLVHAKY